MNGNWYPWRVASDDAAAFVAGWERYRALQQRGFSDAQRVFNVNRESVGSGLDWRKTFPGPEHVDVLSVDYYNHYHVRSDAEFRSAALQYDSYGGPKGLLRHLEFASSVGLPLAISEWSGNADMGDSPALVRGVRDFLQEHGGTGPGQVLYECLFNVDRDGRNWSLSGHARMPASAEAYRRAW